MATEKIEIEILAKGKPAEKAIKGVEQKTDQLGKTSKKVGKETDGMLSKMKLGWVVVGATIVKATASALQFERASIGLTKAQKDWAMETSLATDITAEQVAGFLKSAQTAGLAEDSMKDLAKQAIALGFAFPHEDAETLHDNLVMLAKTGEAQGFVVDILEQKYVGLGEEISTLDLKTKSWSEKMALVGDVAAKSQEQMDASKFTDYHRAVGSVNNAFTELGTTLITLGSDGKGFSFAAIAAETFKNAILFIAAGIKQVVGDLGTLGEYLGIFEEKLVKLNVAEKEQLTTEQKLANLAKFRTTLTKDLTIATGAWRDSVVSQIKTVDEQIEGLTKYGDAHHFVKEKIQESKDAHEDLDTKMYELNDTGKDVASSLGDYFAKMALGIKTSFADMARNVILKLFQVKMEAQITAGITKAAASGGIIGDIAGFFTTPTTKHTGGAIGMAAIPSFHTGYRSDERLAKLQVGESVVNRAGTARNAQAIDAMNAGQKIGGGDNIQNANITFQVQAFDSASFQQGMVQNRATIVGVVREAFNRNGKSVAL